MGIIKTVLKAKIKKQPVIVITFDDVYGFANAKCSRVSDEKFNDAALFLVGKSHEQRNKSAELAKKPKAKRKKENAVHKFFRILFTREDKIERVVEFPLSCRL